MVISKIYDEILERDNYTCQICGKYGLEIMNAYVTTCLICEEKGINYSPRPKQKPPKPCIYKSQYRACGECKFFRYYNIEVKDTSSLIIHHIDGNHYNNNPSNLITLCISCHRIVHPAGKLISIEEAKKRYIEKKDRIKKAKEELLYFIKICHDCNPKNILDTYAIKESLKRLFYNFSKDEVLIAIEELRDEAGKSKSFLDFLLKI
jgi:5-methylcytosine-specific restriction endonuclease McrA